MSPGPVEDSKHSIKLYHHFTVFNLNLPLGFQMLNDTYSNKIMILILLNIKKIKFILIYRCNTQNPRGSSNRFHEYFIGNGNDSSKCDFTRLIQ